MLRKLGLGFLGLVAAAVVALGTVTWMRNSGEPVRYRSNEGGVSVAVPRGWNVDKVHSTNPDHPEFLNGRENAAFGFLQRGGFWVSRWSASTTTTNASMIAELTKRQQQQQRDDWSLREAPVAGFDGIVMRYSEAPTSFNRLRLGDSHVVVRQFVARGFVYQVGSWTLAHAGKVPQQLEAVAQSLQLFAPQSWTAHIGDTTARLKLPGGWVQRETPLHRAVFHALSPGDPVHAWAYVFHYPDAAPAESVKAARKSIAGNGGTILRESPSRLAGRDAIRLDFLFPDGDSHADDVEWFVSDGNGGVFVLAVGRRSGDRDIAATIAAGWRFS